MSLQSPSVAVAYLARGAETNWQTAMDRFIRSYLQYRPGLPHQLYVLFKGFRSESALQSAQKKLQSLDYRSIHLDDDKFDIGAYFEWAHLIHEDRICPLNTWSEILATDWLQKLSNNLSLPRVGLVGATGSYESLQGYYGGFPPFPNCHIRSNAFMIERRLFCEISEKHTMRTRLDAMRFESGPMGMTREVRAKGLEALIVGSNGRGYSPRWWPISETFRLGSQQNLLVGDNQTRTYAEYRWWEKRAWALGTWGHYISDYWPVEELREPGQWLRLWQRFKRFALPRRPSPSAGLSDKQLSARTLKVASGDTDGSSDRLTASSAQPIPSLQRTAEYSPRDIEPLSNSGVASLHGAAVSQSPPAA